MLVTEVAATPLRSLSPGFGLGTCFHAVPFQRRIRVFASPLPLPKPPTAQALAAEVAVMPLRPADPGVPGLGLGTCFHAVPFQCRIKIFAPEPKGLNSPKAQALVAEVAATPKRTLWVAEGSGLGTCFHAVPFQCAIKVCTAVSLLLM